MRTVQDKKLTEGTPEQIQRWRDYFTRTPKNAWDCNICARIPIYRGSKQEYHETYHLMLYPAPKKAEEK